LAGLQDVSGGQRDPEAFESGRLADAVVVLGALPSGRHVAVGGEVEEVPALDLVSVWTDVVEGDSQVRDDPQAVQAGLLCAIT
jgi:hypothetical protein